MAKNTVLICGCNIKVFGSHWRSYRIAKGSNLAAIRKRSIVLSVEVNLTENQINEQYKSWVKYAIKPRDIQIQKSERTIDEVIYAYTWLQKNNRANITFCSSFWHIPRVKLLSKLILTKEMQNRANFYSVYALPPIKTWVKDTAKIILWETLAYGRMLLLSKDIQKKASK